MDDQLPLFTFTVNGSPITGNLTLLDNESTLAADPGINTALDSFIQVDVTDDATLNIIDGYIQQTGMTTFDFETLGTLELESMGLRLYPNPTHGIVYLSGEVNFIESIEIHALSGRRISTITDQFTSIDLSALESSIYFITINSNSGSSTLRFIKN